MRAWQLSLPLLVAVVAAVAAYMSPNPEMVAKFHAAREREHALRGDHTPLEASSTGETLDVTIPGLGTATGHLMTTLFGKKFSAFHSLPYAHPVVEEKRYTYSELWDDTAWLEEPYDATRLRDRCLQGSYLTDGASGSEDCLHVSMYSPLLDLSEVIAEDSWKGRPVIVFIHGGSFTSGEATLYIPSKLMQQDAVVAVVQYRLSTFGFLYSGTPDAPGNMGLYDQLTAIRWVHRFAKHFGGDPDLITVMGQSAGSCSTSLLMISPLLKPESNGGAELVQRFITMSGSALEYWTLGQDTEHEFAMQIASAGCNQTDNKAAQVECMRKLSPEELVAAANAVYAADREAGGLGFLGVVPVVQKELIDDPAFSEEHLVLVEHPSLTLQSGDFTQKPMMMGSVRDEGSMVAGLVYAQFLEPTGRFNDTEYLEFYLLPEIGKTFGMMDNINALSNSFQLGFYPPGCDLADWNQIIGPFVDVCGMLMLKAGMWTQAHYVKNANHENPVYFYSFEYESEHNSIFPFIVPGGGTDKVPVPGGITHTDDLLYLFNLPGYFNEPDKEMVMKMTTLFYNFAKYGNPTPTEAEETWADWTNVWPEFFPKTKLLQILAANMTSVKDFSTRWNYNMFGYPELPVET